MTDNNKDKHLDELLDSLLSAYSAVEPRPGLESRILAQIRVAESSPASRLWSLKWLWAGAAVATAAVLLLALWAGRHHPAAPANAVVRTQPAQPQVRPVPPRPQTRESVPETAASGSKHHQRGKSMAPRGEDAALALNQRPSVFPTPTQLSQQEQLMLRYLAHTPREELIAQSHPDETPAIGGDESGVTVPDLVSVPQKSSNAR